MTPDDTTPIQSFPDPYQDDGPSLLEEALRAGLLLDEPEYSVKTFRGHRRALDVLLPIVEEAGVFSLEQLVDADGLLAVRTSVARAIGEMKFGKKQKKWSATTWEARLGQFCKRCAAAGMPQAEADRLHRTFNQALKQAAKPAEMEPELTDEMLQNLHAEMLVWRDAEIERTGSGGCYETLVGLVGHRGRAVTTLRRDRANAVIAITWAGASRTGDVLALKRGDVQGGFVRTQVAKGHIIQPVVKFPLGDLLPFVRPLLDRVGNDPEAPLFAGDSVLSDVRAMMISAGWPEHHGRLGLHRLRKCLARVLYEHGHPVEDTAAVLTNTTPVVAKAYARHDDQKKRGSGLVTWHEKISNTVAKPPEWRWPDGDEPTDWAMLSGNSMLVNPLSESELVTRGRPGDLERAVTLTLEQLGLEPTDENVALVVEKISPGFSDESPPALSGAWRLRWVEVENEDSTWTPYAACESSQGDVLVAHFSLDSSSGGSRPLWLKPGGLHKAYALSLAANGERMNPGSNPGARTIEAIVPPYAAAMREALDRGDLEAVRRMLDLLAALGGEPA